jgi:hypothetical protein
MNAASAAQASLLALLSVWQLPYALRDRIAELVRPLSVEFHQDLLMLLKQLPAAGLERFVELWSRVDGSMRSAFVAFIVTGDDPDGRFLRYLDGNKDCQEAVDLAFAAHIDSLNGLGKSLSRAGQAVTETRAASLLSEAQRALSEAEKADAALENAEEVLENIGPGAELGPVLHNVQAARSAVEGTKRGLRVLARIGD